MFKRFNGNEDQLSPAPTDTRLPQAHPAVSAKALDAPPAYVRPWLDPSKGVYLLLNRAPCSTAAKQFIGDLQARITPRVGRKTVEIKQALGALVGELFSIVAHDHDGYGYRPMGSGTFSGQRIGYNPYKRAVRLLHASQHVHVVKGTAGPRVAGCAGQATTMQALPQLFGLAATYGITLANSDEHFECVFEPVVLKASRKLCFKIVGGKWEWAKSAGRKMRVAHAHSEVLRSTRLINEINAVLAATSFEFPVADIAHPRLQRIFNNGCRADYDYDMGGRVYANGGYQSLSGDQRRLIKIDGEPSVKIDISASYYSIATAQLGFAVDRGKDAYYVAGIPRCIVKAYVNCCLGSGKPIARWPIDLAAEYAKPDSTDDPNEFKAEIEAEGGKYTGVLKRDYPKKSVERKVLPLFPVLSRIESEGVDWSTLSYTESCVVLATVHELCVDHKVAVLPVHDSIVCPVSKAVLVEEVLSRHFKDRVGIAPVLKRKDGSR